MDHVGSMLACNSESLAIKLSIQIHLNSTFRILSIKIALFSLAVVSAFEVELCLVQEDLADALRVELSCNLES